MAHKRTTTKYEGVYERTTERGEKRYDIKYPRYQGDPGGKFECAGSNLEQARKLRARRITQVEDGQRPADGRLKFEDYATRWLERKRVTLAPSTYAPYRSNITNHVIPAFKSRALRSIRPDDVDDLLAGLNASGLKRGTVTNVLVPLRKMFTDAVRQSLMATNPASGAELPPSDETPGRELPYEATAAIRTALDALAPKNPLRPAERNPIKALLFDVALGTGMRLGELRALRWRDIDREGKLIHVDRAFSLDVERTPKTEASRRRVPIFPSTDKALGRLAARAVERGWYAPDDLLFRTLRGKPLDPSRFNAAWREAREHAKLADSGYRFHDLRHTCVSRLIRDDGCRDIKLIQAIAGHSNPMITLQRYSHLLDDVITEAAGRFDPARNPKEKQEQ